MLRRTFMAACVGVATLRRMAAGWEKDPLSFEDCDQWKRLVKSETVDGWRMEKWQVKDFSGKLPGMFIYYRYYDVESGLYIGSQQMAGFLRRHTGGMVNMGSTTGSVANYGFSPSTGQWYGWSHRAIQAFGKGYGNHEWERAKADAMDFARSVA